MRIDPNSHYTVVDSGCWLWSGGIDQDGYGTMSGGLRAHRFYFEQENGPIPDGMCVCHSCDVRNCVNPEHLFLGTPLDNNNDKVQKMRHVYGERAHKAKLTETNVREILVSDEPCFVLAERYGVSDTAISYVRLGKTWKHVPRPEGFKYTPYRAPGDHTRYEDTQK